MGAPSPTAAALMRVKVWGPQLHPSLCAGGQDPAQGGKGNRILGVTMAIGVPKMT